MSDEHNISHGVSSRHHEESAEEETSETASVPENQLSPEIVITQAEPDKEKETMLDELTRGMKEFELAGVAIPKDQELDGPSQSPVTQEAILDRQLRNQKFSEQQAMLDRKKQDD